MPLTDAQAKNRLLDWPAQTEIWSGADHKKIKWLRAQPVDGVIGGPRLELPGAETFRTQPDGLWITLGIERGDSSTVGRFVDCVIIESCGKQQNFSDKRSRYAARTTSLTLNLPAKWLDRTVPVRGGAQRKRRELLSGNLPSDQPTKLPVRHIRVLYALPDDDAKLSLYRRTSRLRS